jgi:glucuronokinase
MGNPSDGFHGKTIALTIQNYWAQVTLRKSDKIRILPHPLYDQTEFSSLSSLYDVARREGYSGGIRLLMGTCKKFFEWCVRYGIALPDRKFSLSYDTNIPRQVGLAGSSAIVSSTFACLLEFYCLSETEFPKELQPQFVLDVEMQELNINAGLQDRVVQIYQGLVYMDFSKNFFDKQGHGVYEYMNARGLPNLFLAYVADPSDSGKIHNNVRKRWIAGDKVVRDAMHQFAEYTDRAKDALKKGDHKTFTSLMKMNFELRRSVYGDACLGKDNLKMIEIANKYGCAAKFPGSGGAVVGSCAVECLGDLMQAYEDAGFVFVKIDPYVPRPRVE